MTILTQRYASLASPAAFHAFAQRWSWRCRWIALAILSPAVLWALFVLPSEKYMGETVRILFIHVPCAWMSLTILIWIAAWSALGLIWHIKLAELLAMAAVPMGIAVTATTLLTGALWGRCTWGTYWDWDPRLTSELLLLFLYLGIRGLYMAIDQPRTAARSAGLLALIGLSLLPVIHYSVVWWHSLHQGQSIRLFGHSKMYGFPTLVAIMVGQFTWFIASVLSRAQATQLKQALRARGNKPLLEIAP